MAASAAATAPGVAVAIAALGLPSQLRAAVNSAARPLPFAKASGGRAVTLPAAYRAAVVVTLPAVPKAAAVLLVAHQAAVVNSAAEISAAKAIPVISGVAPATSAAR